MYFLILFFYHVDNIAGWRRDEVILMVIFTNLLHNIITFLFQGGLRELPQLINDGKLDFVLLKPVNNRFYISCRNIMIPQLINIILNIVLIIRMISIGNFESINGLSVVGFIFLMFNSIFILYNLFFLVMLTAFWVIKVDMNVAMFYKMFNVGNKPMDIFTGIAKKIFIYIIPIFLIFNYPILGLGGKMGIFGYSVSMFFSIFLFIVSQFVFKIALKRYSSASS